MSDALELRGVTRGFRQGEARLTVLDGVDLTLRAGEVTALVGPSGSGKSTLLHICGLLDRPDSGDVLVAGRRCGDLDEAGRTMLRRVAIGFVYQFHHLLPEFSARENIVLPQLVAGESRKRASSIAQDLLDRVGIGNRADHRPAELSGGEQQRVAIARALANRPRVLLADEPTGNLDPDTSETVFAELVGVARNEGVSALIATHNLDLARRMDRMITMRGGRVEAVTG